MQCSLLSVECLGLHFKDSGARRRSTTRHLTLGFIYIYIYIHTCIYIYSNLWSLFQAGMEELVKAVASPPPPAAAPPGT